MHNEFTAIMEKDEDWYIAYCAEIPGANGQGKTKEECLKNLTEAIELILEDRRQDSLRGVPKDAVSDMKEPITRRQFLNKQFLAPLALIAMFFDEEKEDEGKDTFELDKLPLADKKLFQQLAG